MNTHRTVAPELEASESAERRDILILLSDGLTEHVDLNVTGFLGYFSRLDVLALIRIQRTQQPHRECARRSQPGARRHVGEAGDLNVSLPVVPPENLAEDGVPNLVHRCRIFERRVFQKI